MKKLALVGALAIAACTPDIPKTTSTDHPIIAFDPAASVPVVPTPNDLAIDPTTGKVNAPIDPSSSAANQEFTRDYVNTLDGFPEGTPVASTPIVGGELNPASVNASSVLVSDLTVAASGGDPSVAATIQYDPEGKRIVILPPNGAWTTGHKYDVAVLSGASTGIQLQGGGQVYASPVWALARAANPLVSCQGSVCQSTTSAISDPAQAQQLEQVRLGYAPILDALASNGVPREDVALLWTFSIVSHEMRFDPANSVIPFPNDLVTNPTTGQVNLPLPTLPDGGTDTTSLQAQLIGGLNTLDGFSTTAPIVSENSDDAPALTVGEIDPATVNAGTVALIPLSAPATAPDVKPCLLPDMTGCASTTAQPDGTYAMPDGGVVPQQLQLIPQVPLDEKTSYAGYVTTDLKAKDGRGVSPTTAFALFRMSNSLVDDDGHSTVTGVTDAQAQQIEPARVALKPLFDSLAANGVPRSKIALAWTFHTQSEQSVLNALNAIPGSVGLPTDPITFADGSALLTCGGTCPYPVAAISHAFQGTLASLFALTGPGGTLNPTMPVVHTIPFILTLPAGTPPADGWPVVLFGHGLQGNRTQAMAIANSLAQGGFAMLAIDENWHGERVSCTGLGDFASALQGKPAGTFNDSVACSGTNVCDEGFPIGHCVAGPTATDYGNACTFLSPTNGDSYCKGLGQGQCRPTANGLPGASKCDGADWSRDATGQPAALSLLPISGWNIFNLANLFATRDNFRQQVIDNAQAVRVIQGGDATDINAQISAALSAPGKYLDGTQVHYVGQSLGGILGTLYTASAPDIHKSVLNVPAGDLLRVFLTTPNATLGQMRDGFIATLAGQGIPYGTPAFDNFAGIAKWILDPADPVNSGHALTHSTAEGQIPADRQAFIQYIQDDQFLPNPTTEELVAAAIRTNMGEETCGTPPSAPCTDVFEFTDDQFGADMPANADDRHGFLLNGKGAVTGKGQSQVVQFLVSGQVNPAP